MGGVSTSTSRVTDAGTLEFAGEVSLENNGGFASVRAGTDSLDLSAYDEWVLRVRGDGKRYAFSVQTDYRSWPVHTTWTSRPRKSNGRNCAPPLRLLEARAFASAQGAPPLNVRDIRSLGSSSRQAGRPFRLEVDWIKAAKREGRGRAAPDSRPNVIRRRW